MDAYFAYNYSLLQMKIGFVFIIKLSKKIYT